MIRSTCADIELKLAHAAQPGVCVCGDQTGELYYRNFAVATALHHTPPEIITDALVKRERWVLLAPRHATLVSR